MQRERQGYGADGLLRAAGGSLLTTLQGLAFWSGLLLPVAYTLLFALLVPVTLDTLSVAFGVHAAALVVGHGYGLERG